MAVTNRFKGLDLVVRVPEELWTEICNTLQETVTKAIPKREKCKKAKWLSEEALQTAEKRRDEMLAQQGTAVIERTMKECAESRTSLHTI